MVLDPDDQVRPGGRIVSADMQRQTPHRDQIVPFLLPSLVVSTMAVPHYKLGALRLSSAVQYLTVELGRYDVASIGLTVQLPQLVVGRRTVLRVHDNFHPVIVLAPGNIKHVAIKA